jgi:hypothetical protein
MSFSQTGPRLATIIREGTSSFVFHLLFAMLVTVLVFLHPPAIFSGDTDTARNYLNTIVSSLSTILALCISIILVAIQMTAANYTHRVLDFYVRLPYNVSLFFFYLATIIHSLFLMARIRDPLHDPLPGNLSEEMSADLVLVVICFFSLLLYMYAVVQLLKPDRIIELIVREYNRAFSRGRLQSALLSVEQICDIAKRAASFSDSLTGMECIHVMTDIARRLPLPEAADDPMLSIHGNIIDQFVEIVGVAVKERETGVLTGVLGALSEQGRVYVEGESWRGAELVIRAYRQIASSHLITDGYILYIERVVERLYELSALSAKSGQRGVIFALRTWQIACSIGEVSVRAHPASAAAALGGFLMFDSFYPTLMCMSQGAQRVAALASYFQLWKAFAAHASMGDVARWANWWNDTLARDREIHDDGVGLALLLSTHLKVESVRETLCHVWASKPTALRPQFLASLKPHCTSLFDGWPVPVVDTGLL